MSKRANNAQAEPEHLFVSKRANNAQAEPEHLFDDVLIIGKT